ncbi:MAG: C39 family peptidase [Anaerolineaceae bacterium]|jgi:tetratricopeptide (TPR) repeat protein|nr:C39 family peptidase [Anaerolineaceae bacterium]
MLKKNLAKIILGSILFFSVVVIVLFSVPSLREKVLWKVDQWKIQVDYALNPPEAVVFVPDAEQIESTPIPMTTPTQTIQPTATHTVDALLSTATPTLEPTPLPSVVKLDGITYQDQHGLWNYCAPANLAMQLSFWGWEGDRLDTGQVLKPFEKDKNVMLYEMADFVIEQTQYQAITRSGGNLTLLKKLIANGFPVLVEKGVFIRDTNGKVSWMGHYAVLNGYDDEEQQFLSQDSYFRPDFPVSYDDLLSQWRSFNYLFLVVYSQDQETKLMEVLGEFADDRNADQIAYQLANEELFTTQGNDLFYAWFNRGTSMVQLQDYAGAAEAYDQAFLVYSQLPEKNRPWRIMWYQTGPYFAYFYSGRYQDVINLATLTIDAASEPYLEESFYWRARAYVAVGFTQSALEDLYQSLEYHPNFAPSVELLKQLGYSP